MTAIKKLIDGNGNQFFPQTHTKAVVDDNGYSVESRMQAVQAVVNQAQMEVGAVPSDFTPTENSSNWVTSGGVYNAIQVVQSDITELEGNVQEALDNVLANIGYFTCDTEAGIAEKVVSASGYALTTGGIIRIKMTNTNTADNVTLNINNTGAKTLLYNGSRVSSEKSWEAGEVLEVYYDGTQYQAKGGDDINIEKMLHSYNITKTSSSYGWVFSPRFQVSKGDFIRYKLMGYGDIVYFYHDTTTAATSGETLDYGTSDSKYKSGELEIQEDGYVAFRSRINKTTNESYGEHYQKIPIEQKITEVEAAIKVNADDIADINLKNDFDKYEFDMSTSNLWRSSSYIYVNVGDILVINNFNVANNAYMVRLYSDRGTTLIKTIASGAGAVISATYIMDTAGYLFFRNQDGNGNAILYLKSSSLTLREMLKVTIPFNGTDTDPTHWKRTKPYRVLAGDTYEVNLQGTSGSFFRLYADEECTQLLEDVSGSTSSYWVYTKLVGTISANGYLVARAHITADNAYCYIYKQGLSEYLGDLSATGRNITIASSTSSPSDKNIAQVVCTGLHDEQTIQSVIDSMGGYGVIYFKAGVYFIDGFTDDANGGPSYAMRIPYNSNFRFVGDIQSYKAGKNIQSFNGVRFAVTDAAYSSCDDNGLYAVFGGTKGGSSDDAHIIMTEKAEFEHVCVSLPNNQKPIICFDGWNVGQMRVSKFIISTPFNNRGTITSIGIDNCIGIRGHQGSNNGADSVFESGYIIGLGVACSVCGEHTKWIDLDCIGNKYAYWVNQFASVMAVGANTHPITIIGCTDEVSARFMRFGANARRQVIDIINFEMELYPDNLAIGNSYATEDVPGQWYGNIDYSLQEFVNGDTYYLSNSPTRKFWADGHGKNMNSRNNAQKQVVTSTELLTYAPNFNQIVYCSTLNKPLICTNPSTKEWRDFNGTIVNLS